jgi:hypothetical protein
MTARARPVQAMTSAGATRAGSAPASRTPVLMAAGLGLILGLLAIGPGLAPGYLLSYDMVFVPDPPFSAALIGITGGPARAVPSARPGLLRAARRVPSRAMP